MLTNAGQKGHKPNHVGAVWDTGIISIYMCLRLGDEVLGNKSAAKICYHVGIARSNAFCQVLQRKEKKDIKSDGYL